MKKLILILCIAFVGYGCKKIEPKVLIPYPNFNDILVFGENMEIINNLKKEETLSIFDGEKWSVLDMSTYDIEYLTDVISILNQHNNYYNKSIEYNEYKTANFAYDAYMSYLESTVISQDKRWLIEIQMENLVKHESNPAFRVIAMKNFNTALELLEKLEENWNANLQAN